MAITLIINRINIICNIKIIKKRYFLFYVLYNYNGNYVDREKNSIQSIVLAEWF